MNLKHHIRPLLILLACFIGARVAFMIFMPFTFSKDLYAWLNVMNLMDAGKNPYQYTSSLNWPPFWMQILYFIHKLSVITTIRPERLIQMLLIVTEAMMMLVCYDIMRRFFKVQKPAKILIVAVALNPVFILLDCQHCNFDIFVGFWIMLFIWLMLSYLQTKRVEEWLMACFILGMGILTKTVPLILIPFLFIGVRRSRPLVWLAGALMLFMPVVIGMSIIYTLSPQAVTDNVLHYRSMPGWYGITGFMGRMHAYDLMMAYMKISPFFFLSVMLYTAWKCFKAKVIDPRKFISAAFLIMLLVPNLGPGYSPPYILWFIGLMIVQYAIAEKRLRAYLIIGFVILSLTYITEYAFFPSHGAFMTKIDRSSSMQAFSEWAGSQGTQVLIRLPMFLYYIGLIGLLIQRFLRRENITTATV